MEFRPRPARSLVLVTLGTLLAPATTRAQESPDAGSAEPRTFAQLTIHREARPLAPGAIVNDWPSFLGANRDASCVESPLDLEFGSEGPRLLWEMKRGEGYASPAIAQGRLVFTHRVENEAIIECLEATTGKRYWQYRYPCDYEGRYIKNGGPRSTPSIAGDRVFVHGVDGVLIALDLATGEPLWQRNTTEDYKVGDDFFGVVSSPLVVGDQLIQNVGAPGGPTVAAFDIATGKQLWGLGTQWGPSCASPIVGEVHGKQKLYVLAGGKSRPPTGGLVGIDLASRELDFEYSYRSRTYESVNGATPVLAGNRVFLTVSYGVGSAALEIDEQGKFKELWKNRHFALQFSTPVFRAGELLGIDGVSGRAGALVAIDPTTGEERWRESLAFEEAFDDAGESKTLQVSVGEGSLMKVGDQLLVLGDVGLLLAVSPGKAGAEILAHAPLFHAAETWTPLVLSHGLLYVCQNNRARFGAAPPRLLCYDLRGGDRQKD